MTNEVIKAMIERRSCRKFKAEQIKERGEDWTLFSSF